jgi:hypothetical protein
MGAQNKYSTREGWSIYFRSRPRIPARSGRRYLIAPLSWRMRAYLLNIPIAVITK